MISFDIGITYIATPVLIFMLCLYLVLSVFAFGLLSLVVSSRCSAFPLWQDMFIGFFIVSIVNKVMYYRAQ
jgi:hypothetical protein